MQTIPTQATARQVYTLCYRITGCQAAAWKAALAALADPRPLPRAVACCLAQSAAPDPDAGRSDWERALFTLPREERLALLLMDGLELPPAEAARWAQLPQEELRRLCYAARLAMARAMQ